MALRRWNNKTSKPPPTGFDIIEPVLDALENELRDKVKESNIGKRNTESMWPIHQIGYQKTRYVYDMYYIHHRISKKVYDFCLRNKLIDANLIAKWKKTGYEKLCSTYAINPANYKFGGTSICRVPLYDRSETQLQAQDPTTGCLGCASGKGAGPRNIFGNKYGQNLAAVQIAREKRMEEIQAKKKKEEEEQQRILEKQKEDDDEGGDEETDDEADENPPPPPPPPPTTTTTTTTTTEPNVPNININSADVMTTTTTTTTALGDSETDDSDDDDEDDDYGPSPAAGVWAGSEKLVNESEAIAEGIPDDDEEDDDGFTDEDLSSSRPNKKSRIH